MTELKFNADGLDVWTEPVRFEVTRERLQQYAAAVNDPIPGHVAGDLANPVFAIVPVFESLMEPAIEVVPLSLMGKILHGKQDFRFLRPIKPGDVLTVRGRITGWQGQANGTAGLSTQERAQQAPAAQRATRRRVQRPSLSRTGLSATRAAHRPLRGTSAATTVISRRRSC